MIRLFSTFDRCFYPGSFLLAFLVLRVTFNSFTKVSVFSIFNRNVFALLNSFFYSIKPLGLAKNLLLLLNIVFRLLAFLNFTSILPWVFSFTRQLRIVLATSLIFWGRFILFFFTSNLKGFLAHSVPEGTPIYLVWFLFIIEIIRNLIRPITLTVRLVANILAGHLIMILLSQLVEKLGAAAILYAGLNLVEFFVAVIQSYIFVTILILYYGELE